MWTTNKNFQARGFSTPPPPTGKSRRWSPGSPMGPLSEKKPSSSQAKADLFHVIHKVPAGDSPYVRAKHVQLIEKDPSRAISLFWAAINSGDRVDSALKDMAVVMKQLNRSDEAIEAIKSFRHLCPLESQESLDNVLVELYKRSGRIDEQIEMLQRKVKIIEEGMAFGGRRTKSARSQGKKIQITVGQEYSRLLGNLAWAYLQQNNFKPAEELYRKALSLEPDKNKQCNLAICLMHMDRLTEAKFLLQTIASPTNGQLDDSFARSFERAIQMLTELESKSGETPIATEEESHKEIRTPFTSLINRNLEELPTFKNGSQNYVSGSRISVFGHDKEAPLLYEQDRGSCFQSQHEKKNNFFVSDRGHSKDTSFGLGNCSQSSPRTSYVDSLKKGSCSENQYERTADFGSKRNDKWKRAYVSPVPARGIPKVPFTQPRRGSLSFNYRDQRMAFWGDGVVGGCNRKLSFEQSRTHENFDGQLPAATNELSKAALPKSESDSPCVRGGCRKRSWRDLAEVNDESALEPILNRELERNLGENDNLAMNDESAFSKGDWHRSSNICTAGSGRLTETFEINSSIKNNSGKADCSHEPIENVKPTQELQTQIHPIAAKLEHSQDIFTCKSKKSWADMVEEDEHELSGRNQCPENSLVYPSRESSFSSRAPSRGSDGWNSGEEFDDENMNSNITYQILTPLDQIEKLRQKIESCDLKEGYYTQPENATSSMNRTARRSLCFDQQQKLGRTDNYCPSPLPKKVLNYEDENSLLGNESECISGSGIKLLRRNRLKVFRDITLSSESPRP